MHNLSKWVVTMQREYQKYRSRCHMCQVIIYSIGGKASDVRKNVHECEENKTMQTRCDLKKNLRYVKCPRLWYIYP